MKISSRISPNQFLKLILITLLALSSKDCPANCQHNSVAYNDTRQSSNQTQGLSCELARASGDRRAFKLNQAHDAKTIITNRDEDLDNSAATTSIVQMGPANKETNLNRDQETSPSVTSVHQVWTSSSSGSIGELSPEIISKLRNDVPFLAAYALRPRLVGASSSGNNNGELNVKLTDSNNNINKLDDSNQPLETYVGQLQPSAKAGKTSLQVQASSPPATKSLIPKLGDFSEFNVETLSSSKSEHHHKRKTTLKRKTNDNDQTLSLEKRTSADANQLLLKGVDNLSNKSKNKSIKKNKRRQSRAGKTGRRGRRRSKSRSKSSKLRAKLNGSGNGSRRPMNIIRHGRYYQEQSFNPSDSDNSTEMVVDSRATGDQTTMLVSGTKNSSEAGDVKGGSSSGDKKPRFYSKIKPTIDMEEPASDDRSINDAPNDPTDDGSGVNSLDRAGPKDDQGNELDNTSEAEEGTTAEEPLEPPKRVGDDDVEEDGDTVTVMPKFDGVDDDPEIPAGAPEEDRSDGQIDSGGQGETREREDDPIGAGELDNRIPENDPRGRRVDREHPNPSLKPSDSSDTDSDSDDGGRRDITAGGGIGATTGIGRGSSPRDGAGDVSTDRSIGSDSGSGDVDNDDDGLDDSNRSKFGNSGGGSSAAGSDGAQIDDDRTPITSDKEETTRDRSEAGKGSNGNDSGEDDSKSGNGVSKDSSDLDRDQGKSATPDELPDEFDSRRSGSGKSNGGNNNTNQNGVGSKTRPLCPEDGSPCLDGADEGGDVDYRDEMAEAALGRKNTKNGTEVETDKDRDRDKDEQGVKRKKKKHGEEAGDKDCDEHHKDGHYDHHAHDHHDHHSSIKWLQDAIPGEPGQDYPILSRINLSNFNCRDQKYPGYYADVQSRCQVSGSYIINELITIFLRFLLI